MHLDSPDMTTSHGKWTVWVFDYRNKPATRTLRFDTYEEALSAYNNDAVILMPEEKGRP